MSILGHSNKTDKQAAYALSLAGRTLDLKPYTAPTREMEERKQLMSSIGALEKQERMLLNQIHALEQLPFINEQAMNSLKQVLEMVKEQIKPLKEQLYNDAEDKEFTKKKHLISSVVGIGNKTAEAILLVTNGLNNFNSAGQVAKFLGITPYSQESGTSVKVKGRITKKGSHEVRSLLYMCAVSAVKHNLACKELFERMRKNGKPYKVAMVAVMHKLVKQLFACVKKEIPFDNEFHLKENKKAKK
jgi:transposase